MIQFLTSSPTMGWAGDLNPANGFLDELRQVMPPNISCLMITSSPDDLEMTDRMAWELREEFEHADFPFEHYEVLDRRTQHLAAEMIERTNFIILCGGHVPTQNSFFKDIDLREKLMHYDGVIVSISAGSMNSADVVYSAPELDGETCDPRFMRYITGLEITSINIFPHYHTAKYNILDGMPMEQIVKADSYSRPVYLLPDGSFFKINRQHAILHGECFLMNHGVKSLICNNGETHIIY